MPATTINPTTWTPPSGQGETSSTSADKIVDSSGNNIADSSSNQLAGATSTPSSVPATAWTTDDGE